MSRGRPSLKTPKLCAEICNLLAEGHTLRSICRDDGFPDYTNVLRWLSNDEDFRRQYTRARQDQADYFADEIVDLSAEAVDRETAAAAKVKIDARIWHASKTAPKKYGDKGTEINVQTTVVQMNVEDQTRLQERHKAALVEAQKLLANGSECSPPAP